jgi:ribonuclease D
LQRARAVVAELADTHRVLAQNLLPSDILRRICWSPPEPLSADTLADRLDDLGARPWQVQLTAAPLAAAWVAD